MIHAVFAAFFGLGLEDGHVPPFGSLLQVQVQSRTEKKRLLYMRISQHEGPFRESL